MSYVMPDFPHPPWELMRAVNPNASRPDPSPLFKVHIHPPDIELQDREYGGRFMPKCDVYKFCQTLAKIAHGFLVLKYGVDGFEPYLRRFILSPDEEVDIFNYVGSTFDEYWVSDEYRFPISSNPISVYHSVRVGGDGWALLLVNIFILPNIGIPRYCVVVGRCRADQVPTIA